MLFRGGSAPASPRGRLPAPASEPQSHPRRRCHQHHPDPRTPGQHEASEMRQRGPWRVELSAPGIAVVQVQAPHLLVHNILGLLLRLLLPFLPCCCRGLPRCWGCLDLARCRRLRCSWWRAGWARRRCLLLLAILRSQAVQRWLSSELQSRPASLKSREGWAPHLADLCDALGRPELCGSSLEDLGWLLGGLRRCCLQDPGGRLGLRPRPGGTGLLHQDGALGGRCLLLLLLLLPGRADVVHCPALPLCRLADGRPQALKHLRPEERGGLASLAAANIRDP